MAAESFPITTIPGDQMQLNVPELLTVSTALPSQIPVLAQLATLFVIAAIISPAAIMSTDKVVSHPAASII